MVRLILTDEQWSRMEPHCLGKPGDPGRNGTDNRMFMEAVLRKARTGSPWRALPEIFGKWNTIFKRFSDEPDMEYAMMDAMIILVHRHGHGAKGEQESNHWQIKRGIDNQNSCPNGCFGQSCALLSIARQSAMIRQRLPV